MAYVPPDEGTAFPAAMLKIDDPATETGNWYYIAGRINTSASYTWYGENTFENTVNFNTNLVTPAGVNSFLNPTQRSSQLPTPLVGSYSFLRQTDAGIEVNNFQYYDGASWLDLPVSSNTVTLTGTQTLTNKTLTSPVINTAAITGGTITTANITGGSITNATEITLSGNQDLTSRARNITISTSAPTGGNDGDVWLVYS